MNNKYKKTLRECTQAGVRFFYRLLLVSKATGEDNRRREFILNIMLLSIVGLASLSMGTLMYNIAVMGPAYQGMSLASFSHIWSVFIILFIISRKINYKVAAYGFIFLLFFIAQYMGYTWGIGLSVGILVQVMVIVMSSILVSTRFGLLMTFLISISVIVLAYFQSTGFIQTQDYWRTQPVSTNDGIHFAAIFAVIMIISWLSNREIDRSLNRARRSELELRKERDSLEIKVEERAQEINKLQFEQVMRLNKFAKFGRFASGLFHDFVNPLTAMSLSLSEIEEITDREKLTVIENQLKQAMSATKRLNEFVALVRTHIQGHEIEKTFSLNEEIDRAIKILDYKARAVQVKVMFDQNHNVLFYGSPLKFHQVMVNIIANAIDAYEGMHGEGHVLVGITRDNDKIEISVKDWGIGIAPENINRIFEPFFTTKKPESGTGIGLSSSKEIVEDHFHGIIRAQSVAGEVTLFTIELPITPLENVSSIRLYDGTKV